MRVSSVFVLVSLMSFALFIMGLPVFRRDQHQSIDHWSQGLEMTTKEKKTLIYGHSVLPVVVAIASFSLVSLLFVLGVPALLYTIGVTEQKNKIGKMCTELKVHTDGLRGAVDGSAVLHEAFRSLTKESIDEFAHSLYGHGVFVMPKAVELAVRSQLVGLKIMYFDNLTCSLYIFMDGRSFPGKKKEDDRRSDERKKAYDKGMDYKHELLELEVQYALFSKDQLPTDDIKRAMDATTTKMRKSFKKSFYRHPTVEEYFISVCRELQMKVYVALYEADSQIVEAVRSGFCNFAVIEDGDAAAYAITSLFGGIKLDKRKEVDPVTKKTVTTNKFKAVFFNCPDDLFKKHIIDGTTYDMINWTIQDVQVFSAFVKCDYCNIENFGPSNTYPLISAMVTYRTENNAQFKDALKHVLTQHQGSLVAKAGLTADETLENILFALAAFNSQYVYDMKTFEQRRLNPAWELSEAEEEYFGNPIPHVCDSL